MEEGRNFSFDEVLFNMIKNAIKQASFELYVDSQEAFSDDFEVSKEEMEKQLDALIPEIAEPKALTIDKMQEMVDDYKEMGQFANAMDSIGYFKNTQDVVALLTSPQKYRKQYLLWVELGRPNMQDKMFEKFGQAVWSRENNLE